MKAMEIVIKTKGKELRLYYRKPQDEVPHAWPAFLLVGCELSLRGNAVEGDLLEVDENDLRLLDGGVEQLVVPLREIVDIQIKKIL
jgi:hypothetical protein